VATGKALIFGCGELFPLYFVVSTTEFRSFGGFLMPSLLSRERSVLGCKPKINAAPFEPSIRQLV
jgi:hypothetical protein